MRASRVHETGFHQSKEETYLEFGGFKPCL